jgi:hypothetical protein
VFGDVGQRQLISEFCDELSIHKVIVDGGPVFLFRPRFFENTDQMRSCEHNRATRSSHAVMPRSGSSSAMKR